MGRWLFCGKRRYRCSRISVLVVGLVLLVAASGASAHSLGQSYLMLSILEDSISARVEIPIKNVNQVLGSTLREDNQLVEEELAPHVPALSAYVLERVRFALDGEDVALRYTGYRLFSLSWAQYAIIEFDLEGLHGLPQNLEVEYGIIADLDRDHRSMLVIENNWRTSTFNDEANVILTFTPDDYRQQLDLSSSLSTWRGFLGMIEIGTHHIAIGLDHILFIVALLLPSVMRRNDSWWEPVPDFRMAFLHVVKVVTLFTIAHSVTLSLATLGYANLPPRLVESVIALSIILVALDIFVPIFHRKIWIVVFAFGLFHGFGFASVLADMGINSGFKTLTLLGFNLGVEVGQLAIVIVVFPLLYLLRGVNVYQRFGLPYGAAALILVAGYWFVERAFNVDLPAGAIMNQVVGAFS